MNKEHWKIAFTVGLICLAVTISWGVYYKIQKASVNLKNLASQSWSNSMTSQKFRTTAKVNVKPVKNIGSAEVIFEVSIENRTSSTISNVVSTVFLNHALEKYVPVPKLSFGNDPSTAVNLIPLHVESSSTGSKGLAVSRNMGVTRYNDFSEVELRGFLEALRKPIRLRISFKGGIEFLEINPEEIQLQVEY